MARTQVRFIYISSDKLNTLPYQEGQIIALTDVSGYFYDMNGSRYKVSAEGNINLSGVPYAITQSSSTTTAFTCESDKIDELTEGTCIYVINSQSGATAAFTLNVNSLGAKPVYYTTGSRATDFDPNEGAFFIYNTKRQPGGCWDMLNDTIYSLFGFGQCVVTCDTPSTTSAKVAGSSVKGFNITRGATAAVTFTHAVIGDATLNIYGSGAMPIIYRGNPLAGYEIPDGATAYFIYDGANYVLISVDSLIDDVRDLQSISDTPGLYWATFDDTSFDKLLEAQQAGKLLVMKYLGITYIASTENGAFVFSPLVRSENSYQYTCTISGWAKSLLELATKAEVNAKYTLPEDGIPMSDLAFVPAEVDNTFTLPKRAAESVITGQRVAQIEFVEHICDFTETYTTINSSQWVELDVEPTTGLELDDPVYFYQACLATNLPFSTDVVFTLDDPNYEWASWASRERYCGSSMTHTAMISGWASGNIPLLLKHESTDFYAALTIRRKDGQVIESAEYSYISSKITVRCKPTLSVVTQVTRASKNNSLLTDQLIAVAETYYNARTDLRPDSTYRLAYGESTILDAGADTNKIDDSTFVGLVLRGLEYGKTSYATGNYVLPELLVENTAYTWAFNPAYYLNKRYSNSRTLTPIRTAGQLAQQYHEWGFVVPIDAKLINLEPGDIIFYAQKTDSGDWVEGTSFMHISHVAICYSKESGSTISGWDTYSFPYCHTIIHVSDTADDPSEQDYCVFKSIAEKNGDKTTPDYTGINYHTICMIARPDLGTLTQAVDISTKVLPVNPFSTGQPGQLMFDENTLYVCVGNNTWKKVSLTSI